MLRVSELLDELENMVQGHEVLIACSNCGEVYPFDFDKESDEGFIITSLPKGSAAKYSYDDLVEVLKWLPEENIVGYQCSDCGLVTTNIQVHKDEFDDAVVFDVWKE